MYDDLERRRTEVHEEITQDEPVPVDRREEVRVVRDVDSEHRERVVEDMGAESYALLSRLTGFIWLLTGLLEFLIGLRILLKLMAANPATPFVNVVYRLSDVFLWPFAGLTVTPQANGIVLELSSLVAMLVYAVLAWALIKVIWLLGAPTRSRQISVERHRNY